MPEIPRNIKRHFSRSEKKKIKNDGTQLSHISVKCTLTNEEVDLPLKMPYCQALYFRTSNSLENSTLGK